MKIMAKESFKIPGTDIIVESGTSIEVLDKVTESIITCDEMESILETSISFKYAELKDYNSKYTSAAIHEGTVYLDKENLVLTSKDRSSSIVFDFRSPSLRCETSLGMYKLTIGNIILGIKL